MYRTLSEEETFQESSRDADPFLFGPESEMWRISRERCGLIYGSTAAILQLAHPRIAQGVYDHSNFRRDSVGRLYRTLKSTNQLVFGRVSEAEAMRTHLAAVHGKVRGPVSPGIQGSSVYSAFEPDLLFWVLATLITGAVDGYEFIHGELTLARKEAFYRDACRFGSYFGVDETHCPKGWRAFQAYYKRMVEGDLLGSIGYARSLPGRYSIRRIPSEPAYLDAPSTFSRSRHYHQTYGIGSGCAPPSRAGSACSSLAGCCQEFSRFFAHVCGSIQSI